MIVKITDRRYIAHLLFLLTTRSHIKTYRIQAMYSHSSPGVDCSLEQQRYSFNDQYLAALLQVYKDYYPDIIISSFRRAKSSVFRHPDPPLFKLPPTLPQNSNFDCCSTQIQPSKQNSK